MQQLIAYLVPRTGGEFDEDQIRKSLRDALPVYMIPSLFEPIESLPTLTSGKVDRKQLPPPRPRGFRSACCRFDRIHWTPKDPFEEQLSMTWTSLFSAIRVGPHDDFFVDLGGHSLLAARMVSALRKYPEFADVSMLDIYNHPTITQLAGGSSRSSPVLRQPRTTSPRQLAECPSRRQTSHVVATCMVLDRTTGGAVFRDRVFLVAVACPVLDVHVFARRRIRSRNRPSCCR